MKTTTGAKYMNHQKNHVTRMEKRRLDAEGMAKAAELLARLRKGEKLDALMCEANLFAGLRKAVA